jgi:hypothetical protein
MPRRSPYRIELSDEERAVLESLARSYTLPYDDDEGGNASGDDPASGCTRPTRARAS